MKVRGNFPHGLFVCCEQSSMVICLLSKYGDTVQQQLNI